MMRHRLTGKLLLIICFTLLLRVNGQDERVHPYMQAVSDQFRMDEGYKIKMDYIREDIMQETSVEGSGTIWMKGYKYKIEVDEFIVYFDGEKLYSQNTDAEEVYVSVPDPDEPGYIQAVPLKVIKSYHTDFRYQYMGKRPFMGKQRIEIQLYPLELNGPYSMLKLFINPETLRLEAFVLKHKEGINYTMIITSFEGNQNLPDETFRFDPAKYPDTEVIELLE
jgi:outer membrane lipoprotein-sorting protein